jgi:proteic killer suppression protein
MIVSFGDGETEKIWRGERSRKLRLVDAAQRVEDLRVPPGNRLEKLAGAWAGSWSIRINDQWRIVFRWAQGGAENVSIVDYH